MKTAKLLAALLAAAAALLVWRALAPPTPVELAPPPAARADRPATPRAADADDLDPLPDDVERAVRARYRFSYTLDSLIGDAAGPSMRVAGEWQTEALADGRVEARLIRVTTSGHHLVPRAEALTAPVELVPAADGTLEAIAFAPGTEDTARRLYTALAAAFWYTPGDGEQWTADEDDLMGRARVRYSRLPDDRVERALVRYLSLRSATPGQSTPGQAAPGQAAELGKIEPRVTTTYVLDPDGPLSVHQTSEVAYDMGAHAPRMVAASEARFERIGVARVARRDSRLVAEPVSGHFDAGANQAQVDVARVDGATAGELVTEVERVATLDPQHPERDKWRAATVQRLASLVRVDPAAAAELARAVVEHADDRDAYTLLTGGLGSADSVTGAEALAGLLDPALADALPPLARRNAIDHLMLTEAGSAETVGALTGELDGAQGPAAAAALGAQARTLADDDPALAAEAVSTLLGRWRSARTPDEAVDALRALGNSGSPEALGALRGAVWASDARLAETATYGLRFVPGEAADAVLGQVMTRGGTQLGAAIRAVAYRDQTRWQPALEALRVRYATAPQVVSLIDGVLSTWGVGRQG